MIQISVPLLPPEDAQPADLGLQHAEYGHELSSVSTQEWLNMILSLNEEQKPVHQFVLEWCTNEQLSTMRSKLGNLALLIIDEISMVGSNHLLTIHRRRAEIMNFDEPFGGVSLLAVGDLYQLPPVGHFPIYTPPSYPFAALYGSLWKRHFKIIELTQIMRQKNDIQFADALNRFRTEDQTEEDIELIKTRNVDNLGVPAPQEALHIYALNKDVDAHNEKMLNILCEKIITIKSIDSKTDQQTGRIENISLKEKESQLWKEIKVPVGARVMLTKNDDVNDGLANTAMGTIKALSLPHRLQTILTSARTDQNTSWSTSMKKELVGEEDNNLNTLYQMKYQFP